MSLDRTRSVRYERFEKALLDRLSADGYVPVMERFPLAGHELGLLGFNSLVKVKAGRSYVVGVARGDALVQEQLRYLSDQYYNALLREKNELKQNPGLVRGICIFAFEKRTDQEVVGFLMQRVRPRSPFAVIRSLPWVLDMEERRLQRPTLTRSPFDEKLLWECVDAAARG